MSGYNLDKEHCQIIIDLDLAQGFVACKAGAVNLFLVAAHPNLVWQKS